VAESRSKQLVAWVKAGGRSIAKNRAFWLIAIASVLVDRLTKAWVEATFALTIPPQTIPLIPGWFHFTYVVNSGAAFSLFQGSGWLRWLSFAVSAALMALALCGPRMSRWEQWGYGFVLGGALGNGIDRFALGHVIDFLDLRVIRFPVFNLADVSINLGILCLLIAMVQRPDRPNPPNSQP